ncbi:hypothetical protein BD408DRAFT_441012 [Parasitella parasitica]|nr:hypothetical protein BD408DRAFT_441012 [Parasitella parasitica]
MNDNSAVNDTPQYQQQQTSVASPLDTTQQQQAFSPATNSPYGSEVDELIDEDDDDDSEYQDENEDKDRVAKIALSYRIEPTGNDRISRSRVTDAQPTARELTAEEADFADSMDSPKYSKRQSPRMSSKSNQALPTKVESPSRSTLQNHSSTASIAARNDQSTSQTRSADNASTANSKGGAPSPIQTSINNSAGPSGSPTEREESGTEDEVPEGYYIVEKTQTKRKIAKTRVRTLRWTAEEVEALEDGLYKERKRAWASILSRHRSRLGAHTQTQLKDKAVNEVKRRKKLKLPLGGFYYVEHPMLDEDDYNGDHASS